MNTKTCKFLIKKLYLIKVFLCLVFISLFQTTATAGDRLLATGGVSEIEGAAGGGLVPWALIAGYGTDNQVGVSGYYTKAMTNGDFVLKSGGVALGIFNRLEISLSKQKFGLSDTVPNQSITVDTLGIKFRVLGDAIYDQDRLLPQISIGTLIKHNEDFKLVPKTLGAIDANGADLYIAASKLYLGAFFGRNLLINGDLIATKENQFGILGFGGDRKNNYQIQPAVSAAIMATDNLLIGSEYRAKPNNLNTFEEEDSKDIYVAWFPFKNLSLTGAYVDLGNIANKRNQTAWYLSGQVSY